MTESQRIAEAAGWRTIDSAPKDGTVLRVRYRNLAPFHAFWKYTHWHAIEYSAEGLTPTHWLPEPPK